MHAVASRSRVQSQSVKGATCSDHMFGPLLEVQMSKKSTRLWREARFEVKMLKHITFGPLLDVEASFLVTGAMDFTVAKSEQNVRVSCNFQKT